MKFVKITSLILALIMTASFAASCTGGDESTTTAPDTTETPAVTTDEGGDETTKKPDTTRPPVTTIVPPVTTAEPTTASPTTIDPESGKVIFGEGFKATPSGLPAMADAYANYPFSAMFDGDTSTRFASAGNKKLSESGASATVDDYWFTVDFGSEITINYINADAYGESLREVVISTSADGETWTDIDKSEYDFVANEVQNNHAVVEITFKEDITTRYMKIKSVHTQEEVDGNKTFSLFELTFYKLPE